MQWIKNLPANAGDTGLIPASEQLSLWAVTAEAHAPRASALQKEKGSQLESSPHSLQIEKARVSNEDPAQPKK